jgi:uncharacterized membrane protein
VLVFLVLFLLAVQVTYQLYATSMVTAAAFDGARLAAGAVVADDGVGADVATERVRDLLGTYGREHVQTLDVRRDGDVLVLHVVTRNPGFLPVALRRPMRLDRVDRTVRVRIEQEVAP